MISLDGLMLESKYGELSYLIKGPIQTTYRDGFPRQEPKIIALQFDRYVCDVGNELSRMELTEEDREYVARRIEGDLKDPLFTDFAVHEPPKIHPPWPTYDRMHPNAVAGMARQVGMVEEALAYEQRRDGGPRESVVKKLEETLREPASEDDFAAV